MRNFISVKPDLHIVHIVVTIAQHACDRVLKPGLHIAEIGVSTVANMFLYCFKQF